MQKKSIPTSAFFSLSGPKLGSRGGDKINGAKILLAHRCVVAQDVSFLPAANLSGPRTVRVVILFLVVGGAVGP